MKNEPISITIIDMQRFSDMNKSSIQLYIEKAYQIFWNQFMYSPELALWLEVKDIKFIIKHSK